MHECPPAGGLTGALPRQSPNLGPDPAAARAAMVARLEDEGALRPGPVREALLQLPREVLMPQGYARRTALDELPVQWQLLDWSQPDDRPEYLDVLHGGESVLIQHDGEPILGRDPGVRRTGGTMTSLSSGMFMTAVLMEQLRLRPGLRVADVGTGAAVTCAISARVCGDSHVVSIDRDPHVTEAARHHLAALGLHPTLVTGDGEAGWPAGAPFDRIFASYSLARVPTSWMEQLAPGGTALLHVTTGSPSWPGLAVVSKGADGQVTGEFRPVRYGHRAGHGLGWIFLKKSFRDRIQARNGATITHSRLAPPPDTAHGFWLALNFLHRGLVRDRGAEDLVIGAPACGSWVTARPDDTGGWEVASAGLRDIWEEIHHAAALWKAAERPDAYRFDFGSDGHQQLRAGAGRHQLAWTLPATSTPSAIPGAAR
ncbi:methyltransferase domain-containing protein [Streptomyces sp. DK15]|uniref:protein-L-isoaspartate O-methyltransferase family protein n=1 Tax=Streptomyces sp. DK15 TaxID=2957499 RepID=UPI0029A16D7F|nr:methyltransferase domain-containing protein [Streptomyces sp. DK15]MDX2394090.1 methyltransferase domain-containing protein [Streptomyces sp. DK15]